MATMNISLPQPMKAWVEAQADSGRYSNASDYVRDLIRRDQERAAKINAMERLVTEGLESGISERTMAEIEADALKSLKDKSPRYADRDGLPAYEKGR
ncbi:MAG: type II toxin-antitoxin system ParD family antitoxin [Pseudomonadota bacterium]|nr:type II toxin-antitoxin system ParD family antitoxin [Pseudomonadota bacterium]